VLSRCLFALCLAAGCGFSTPSGTVDAAHEPDAPADAPTDEAIDAPPSACMPKWMNGTVALTNPMQLTQLGSTFSDRDPFISADDLRLYFSSERSGGGELYVASRASPLVPFGTPALATDLNSANYDSRVSMTENDLIAVEASDRTGGSGFEDLWIATRASTAVGFSGFTRTPFGTTNDADHQLDPEINAAGTRVYFAYGYPQHIVVLSRTDPTATFGPMVDLIPGGGDSDPALSVDERLILFGSTRTGGPGGGGDIWYTTRANALTLTLDIPKLVPAVNGAGTDGDPALSDDGCTLYFSSFRTGNWELYVSTVLP
jgi:Tol biopolymer transport system component